MTPSYDKLMFFYHLILNQALRLPFASLTPTEIQHRSHRLTPGSAVIVEQLAKGLRAEPEFFPEMPGKGEELLARQKVADGWLAHHQLYTYLASRAWQSYVLLQSDLNAESQAILAAIRTESEEPFSPATHRWRLRRAFAVAGAFVLADAYYKQVRRTRDLLAAARKQAREEVSRKLGIGAVPQEQKSRRKRRAEQAFSNGLDQLIAEGFQRLLKAMNVWKRAQREEAKARLVEG